MEYNWYCKNCECYYEEPAEKIKFGGVTEYFCTCGSGRISRVKKVKEVKIVPASGRFVEIQNEVIKKYRIKASTTCFKNLRTRTHAHPRERAVCKWKQTNSFASTFTLFHEIGHIENNNSKMRRCEEEYYATVWAIEKCKEYKLEIPQKTIDLYQRYIYRELERGINRGGKNYPTYEELRL